MTFLKQISLLALAACLGLSLVGCQPSDPDAPNVASVSSIAVTPNPVYMEIGGVRALTVTGTFTNNSTYAVTSGSTFASSAPTIARVDSATGYVTALAAGDATITATHTASGKTATTAVSVSPLRVMSIAVSPATNTLAVGATQALTVTATYNNATTGPVTAGSTFVSSDEAVATVSATGIVTAVAEGPAIITVTHTASGSTATASVTVGASAGLVQLVNGVWASNYSQLDVAAWQSIEGGEAGTYIDTSVPTQYWWNGFAPNDATPSFYFGYGINSNAKPWGFGAYVKAPGNAVADVSSYTNLVISVWGNDELMNTQPTLTVILKGATVGACTPESKGTIAVTAAGVQTYTLPLAGLTLQTACGYASVAQALTAGVAEVHIQVLGDNVQYVTSNTPPDFPNGLNVGPITFNSDGGGGGSSGNTGTCSAPCIDFASASVGYTPFEGLVSAAQADDPVDATNKVAKFVKGPAGQPWAGATIYTVAADQSVPKFDLSTSKVVTLRVYAPAAGQKVRLKLEDASNNTIYLEKDALTTKANEWETLSFDFATPDTGVYSPANTYNRVSLFPLFLTAPAAEVTYYFDELKYTTTSGGGGAALVFASNYTQLDPSNWRSTEGGDAGTYIDTSVPTQYWWNGFAPNDATPSFYFGYGINSNAKPWGFGAFVKAPGNGTADVTGKANLKIAVWGNDQLVNTHPTLTLILKGPTVSSCTSELKSSVVVAAAGVQNYTVALSSFTLQTACAYASAAAALAAGVTEVHIQVLGDNVQYVTSDVPPDYPNGLNVGPISFE